MCLKSKCCNHKTRKDQYGVRRCNFCLLSTKLNFFNFNVKKTFFNIFFVLLLCSIAFPQSWFGAKASITKKNYIVNLISNKINNDIVFSSNETYNDSILFNELLKYHIFNPEFAIKSSKYETGHYKSNLCTKYNNLFGTTYVKSEYQDSFIVVPVKVYSKKLDKVIIENLKFATYKTKINSIKDHRRAQKYYSKEIDSRYSDVSNYTETIMAIQ